MIGTDVRNYNGQTFRARMLSRVFQELYDARIFFCYSDRDKIPPEMGMAENKYSRRFNKRLFSKFPFFLNLLLDKDKYDVIYICGEFKTFPFYLLIARIKGIKIVFEAESILSKESEDSGCSALLLASNRVLERFVARNSDHFVALSQDIQEFYSSHNDRISVINAILNEIWFENIREDISPQGKKKVGLIGPFTNARNNSELTFVLDSLDRFDSNVEFHIFGKCDRELPKDSKLVYIGFIQDYSEYRMRLAEMDMVLVPSSIATYGPLTKILEPMACGVPVFTTPAGFFGLDNIEKDQDIFVFDRDVLVEQFNSNLVKIDKLNDLRMSGRTKVAKYYSYEYNKNKLSSIISKI